MESLSEETLFHCYKEAVKLKLDKNFIEMLLSEIKNRNLEIYNPQSEYEIPQLF